MRDNPAYDQIIQGLSGIMSITGTPETAPLRVGYPVADTLGGLFGAFAVTSALVRQKSSGEGAFLDVSMLECTLSALGWPVSNYLTAGVDPHPMGNENMTAAPSGTFRTGDGLLNIAANKQEQFVTLCNLVGRPALATDERFAERETRKRHRAALKLHLEEALAGAAASVWEKKLNRAGVPAGRVLTIRRCSTSRKSANVRLRRSLPALPDGRSRSPLFAAVFLSTGKRHCRSLRLRHLGSTWRRSWAR